MKKCFLVVLSLFFLTSCRGFFVPYTPVVFNYNEDLDISKIKKQVIVCAKLNEVVDGKLSVVDLAKKNKMKKVKLAEYRRNNYNEICVTIYGE